MDDLKPEMRPQLVEIDWQGEVADVATAKGVRAAGFLPNYPEGSTRAETQAAATAWHHNGWEGVVCRSASLHRLRFADWTGSHERWGELAIYPERAKRAPKLVRRISGLGWMNV